MSSEEQDRMGSRLDEAKESIEKIRRSMTERRQHYLNNPSVVALELLPRVVESLDQLYGIVVVLEHRLNELERASGQVSNC